MNTSLKFLDSGNSLFFVTIKKRVDEYFKANNISKYANTAMVLKTIVYLTSFIGLYFLILFEVFPIVVSLFLAIALGIPIVLLVLWLGARVSMMMVARQGGRFK